MENITFWFFSKLPNQISNMFRLISSSVESSLAKPVLSYIQNIIITLGQQKSFLMRKVKVTIKPIGIFSWKNFYSRLHKVLKKIGLFSSSLPTSKDLPTSKGSKIPCKAFPPPYRKEKKSSCKDLPIIPEESVLSTLFEKPQVPKEELFNAASELFGEELIERIQSWKVILPEVLTPNDLLHALALMGHGITVKNLNQLLIKVNKKEVPLQLSKKAEDLSQLPTQDIKKLVDFFRNPLEHLLPGEAKILWEELEKVLNLPPKDFNSKRVAYTKYEYHIDKLTEEAKNLTEEEKKLLFLASSEQLAKFAGYAKPDTICENGMIIPILTKEHGLIYHKLENHINKEGLHCYLFTSVNKNLSLPAQLIFRGTDGKESMKRDILDHNGIGKTAFDKYKNQIAEMINTYCKDTTKPALEICGHSLGAIDAQRATAFCVELFNEKAPCISKLSHISCSAFCSPKLDAATIDQWEKEVNKLKDSVLKLQLNFAYHDKDIVTWAGHKNLFIPEDLTEHVNLQANYLHVTSPSSPLTSTHHRIPFFKGARFDSTTDNREYNFYINTKLAEVKAKQAELNALHNEVLVFPNTEKDQNNNQSIDLISLEMLNTTLDSINAPDGNEPFVIIDFGETEQALQAIELSMYEACCLKEKINVHQTGLSSKDSWLIYLLEKALISPVQTTVSYFT